MRQIAKALALLAALLPSLAAAQTQLPTLPANTVLGRLGVSSGPAQAIPFSTLGPTLITSNLAVTAPLSITGLNLSITGAAGKILAGTPPAFTFTPTLGVPSSASGSLAFANSANSGVVTVAAPSTATSWTFKFPTTAGSNGQALTTDGAGNTSWAAGAGSVNSGTAGQMTYYATTAAAVSGNANATISGAALTLGVAGSATGTLKLSGSSSGTTTLAVAAAASGTLTLPSATDTLVAKNTTDTLTNKTLTSPTMTTPTLGVATATSINKVAITAPAAGSTLTIADGKTLTDTSVVGANMLIGSTGGGFTAFGGATCSNQFLRVLSSTGGSTCASVANTDLTNSSVTIGSTNVALGATAATLAGLTLTAPTINGGTAQALTNLGIRSSGSGAFDLTLANTENLTAGRTLTLTVNNAARLISLSGNLAIGADLTLAGANNTTFTTTGTTNVTLPTSGTLATINTAQTFSSSNIFTSVQQFTDAKFSSGKIYPTADSTTALQVTKADGTTRIMNFDTTNARVGINKTAGAFDLDTNGAVNVGGTLSFTTLDAASLQNSPSTITGLTINNSPSAANDYIGYYNAASGQWRRATVGSIAAGATAGVSSLNGLTGGLSIAQGAGVTVAAAGSSVTVTNATVPANYLYGLTISNDATSDITNEIALSAGGAMESTNANMMVLASALTRKSLNAAWAVGSTQGCRDTGAISNATWFIYLIMRTDLTVVDLLCSLSASAPTMPANYTFKRRIGAIMRASAAIVLFTQDGNHFSLNTPIKEINGVDPGATTAITRTLTALPIGIRVRGYFTHGNNTDISTAVWLTDLSTSDQVPSSTFNNLFTLISTTSSAQVQVYTNASGQVRSRHSARDAGCLYFLVTQGWDDTRDQ